MDDIEYRVGKLDLRPGDVLVVKIAVKLDGDQLRHITDVFGQRFPDRQVIVLDRDVDLQVLTQGSDEPVGFV